VERVVLDPSSRSMRATVRVHVRGTEGELTRGARYGIWIESADLGIPLANWSSDWQSTHPPERGFTVPAGRLRVITEGIPYLDSHHGQVIESRTLGRAETVLDVAPGQATEVELVLGGGGRLEIDVRGARSAADDAALKKWWARYGDRYLEPEKEANYLGAKLELIATDGRSSHRVVRVDPAHMSSSAAGTHIMGYWPLGETHTSELLPPGTYTLEVRQVTRETIVKTVTVVEGETARVELELGG
ncbi:MAG: hypothetical protein AAGI01_18875, partial [Myxococcota bacterium]